MNLRPSGYEPDELPGCSIPRHKSLYDHRREIRFFGNLIRFGDDLLSHVLRRSTIGAKALNGWVRDGTRCFALAMITKPKEVSTSCFPKETRWVGGSALLSARSNSCAIPDGTADVQVNYI